MAAKTTKEGGGPCVICTPTTSPHHSEHEHEVAVGWVEPLLTYIRTDAFMRHDTPLSYQEAVDKFSLDTTSRRCGRALDAVELILLADGWPKEAAGGVSAYVVNASSREPGAAWFEVWTVKPRDARAIARAYVKELALSD